MFVGWQRQCCDGHGVVVDSLETVCELAENHVADGPLSSDVVTEAAAWPGLGPDWVPEDSVGPLLCSLHQHGLDSM